MNIIDKIINSKMLERIKRKFLTSTKVYLKIKKLTPSSSEEYRTVKILNTFGFKTVIDVGANSGQFAESLLDFGFNGKIISFEPSSEAYSKLIKRARKYNNWEVAEKSAIGNFTGHIDLNISNNTLFNSIKNIKNEYTDYNKMAISNRIENVKIHTLDSLEFSYFNKEKSIFLKIDTQGYEKEVLDGAENVLKLVDGIKIEMPLNPIYDNIDFDFYSIMEYLKKRDFICISLQPVATNNKNGIVNEVDGIFIRPKMI